jgi:hypothetical protein
MDLKPQPKHYGTPKTPPSGAAPDDVEKSPVFDRADLPPKI